MKRNIAKTEFLSLSCNENLARQFAVAFVAGLDPTIEELAEIKTSVSEAVSNAIIHGYMGDENGIVGMELMYDEEHNLYITITDNGKGIEDIEKARKPLFTTGNSNERAGMGFTVMESFMDEVVVTSIKNLGTRIDMRKTLGDRIGRKI